jgi:cyclopropane fatty-acyl-phospholipid synthase-like methyltransferase
MTLMNKPFSQSCENNKQPILEIIKTVFIEPSTVWEIGSGTGQHAFYFAQNLSHLIWQATDREQNLPGINSWIDEAQLVNLLTAKALNVMDEEWPCQHIDALFTANTLHIMQSKEVEFFFDGLSKYLTEHAKVCIYGPFNYQGHYTSASNEEFDQFLRARDPRSGIRDFEMIEELANIVGLTIKKDIAMPANNKLLILQK